MSYLPRFVLDVHHINIIYNEIYISKVIDAVTLKMLGGTLLIRENVFTRSAANEPLTQYFEV